ncbi:Uncharacterised protein [Bordetella pertussis]|nr:Uncharacterised protein [Bordetella pertussis]
MRAIAASAGASSVSRAATSRSSRSPAAWPWVSLTDLKPSRSRYSRANSFPSRRVAATARSSAKPRPKRFISPVSASHRASRSLSRSACMVATSMRLKRYAATVMLAR